jgi:hypothetical protein
MAQQKSPATAAGQTLKTVEPSIAKVERYVQGYQRLGWALFPVKYGDKIPACANGFKDASTDWDVFKNLADDRRVNIGLATGEVSGVWVLDVDPRHGGNESLAKLVEQYGPLHATVQGRTQSGGAHYFFRWDPEHPIQSRANILPGIDVRGNNGYAVVPPSVGPQGPYTWVNPPIRTPLAPTPEWLLELVTRQPRTADVVSLPTATARHAELREIANGVVEGGRNHAAARLAGYIFSFRRFDLEIAKSLLETWNLANEPPLPLDELYKTVDSIAKRQARKEGAVRD